MLLCIKILNFRILHQSLSHVHSETLQIIAFLFASLDVLSMRLALSALWCLILRILNVVRCLSVHRVTPCPQLL